MTRREMKERIRELERQVGELEQSPWRYVPPEIMEPFRYPDPCCPYLDKCTACPHRYRITWGDTGTTTDTATWSADAGAKVTYTNPYTFTVGAA